MAKENQNLCPYCKDTDLQQLVLIDSATWIAIEITGYVCPVCAYEVKTQ
jgi:hypothetical protein